MKSRRSVAVAIALIAMTAAAAGQETTDYVIRNYELTADLRAGSPDVRITMDITYEINSGTKSEGFKYIGKYRAIDVRGTDADGDPVATEVQHQRETLIRWRFRPAGPGDKRVRISFTMPDALSGSEAQNVFEAEWAGIFKVPVHNATYRLILPAGWAEDSVDVTPPSFTRQTYAGRTAIDVEQSPLRDRTFSVTFRPGVTRGGTNPYDVLNLPRVSGSGLIMLLLAVFFGLFVVAAAQNAKRGARRRAWDSSGCAGGSSCSSGCGGGGCGGGCGG